MRFPIRPLFLAAFAVVFWIQIPAAPAAGGALAWPAVTQEARPWTRWWWLGSAVDEKNLARELKLFSQAGLGGVEITPIYGAKGAEKRFIPFLSPRYIEVLGFTINEAKKLGLSVDMATGTGWPFGGPQVGPHDVELQIKFTPAGKLAAAPTKFRVKRSAPGGEGFVVNPYSTSALSRYLAPFTAALSKLPAGTRIHGQFHDSFEYKANWSAELPIAFELMHGYRLADHEALLANESKEAIAALSPEDADKLARIKSDYRETLATLHMNYVRAWVKWTRSLGGIAREQAHGAPANLIDLYALADIPETEVFGSSDFPIPGYRNIEAERSYNVPQPLVSRFASSAAHLTGKKLVSSETFTWSREHFHEAPSELKPELDQLFLAGINHVFYHGTAYSPEDAPWPGWLFYASTQYNPRNPLWDAFAQMNTYIARVQSFLQMGEPDTNVLLYWPIHDLWHRAEGWNRNFGMHGKDWLHDTATGDIARALAAQGRQFDFVSDNQLQAASYDKKSRSITTHAGADYLQLIVPPAKYMPVETFAAIMRLVADGAHVTFIDDLPRDVPGFANLDERRAELKKMQFGMPFMFSKTRALHPVTADKGTFHVMQMEALKQMPSPLTNGGLGMVCRKYDDGEIYFIANLTGKPFDGMATLRIAQPPSPEQARRETAALFDPRTGEFGLTDLKRALDDNFPRFGVRLQLRPGESIIVKTSRSGEQGPKWRYTKPAGEPIAINNEWRVNFVKGGAPKLPPSYKTKKLESWTARGGEAERYAGAARYETTFTLPEAAFEARHADWELNLGDVREVARVFVNDKEVDFLWSLPFRTKIGRYLKSGQNTLAIEVTNLAANRIRDLDKRKMPWKNFHEINFVNAHYKPLNAAEWPLQPSGLLGPVTLTPLDVEK